MICDELNLFYLFLGVTVQEHVLVMSYRAGSLSYPGRLVDECGNAMWESHNTNVVIVCS